MEISVSDMRVGDRIVWGKEILRVEGDPGWREFMGYVCRTLRSPHGGIWYAQFRSGGSVTLVDRECEASV